MHLLCRMSRLKWAGRQQRLPQAAARQLCVSHAAQHSRRGSRSSSSSSSSASDPRLLGSVAGRAAIVASAPTFNVHSVSASPAARQWTVDMNGCCRASM